MDTAVKQENYNALLAAATGLQMVAVVSQNSDEELDALDTYSVEQLTTADTDLATTLRQRLHLLRAIREEQAEVLYVGFKNAKSDKHLETFACDMDDLSLQRLDRVVHHRILGESPELAKELTEKLKKVLEMRRELKPIRDGIFRYLATDSIEEAEAILLENAHVMLTATAGNEILQTQSRERNLRKRIDERKKLWRKVYGQHSGKTITGSIYKPELEDNVEVDPYPSSKPKPTIPVTKPYTSPTPTIELNRVPDTAELRDALTRNKPAPTALPTDAAVDEADRLMEDVYALLEEAIGNAMVAFSIYRKNHSERADEALKIVTELHNETKKDKE